MLLAHGAQGLAQSGCSINISCLETTTICRRRCEQSSALGQGWKLRDQGGPFLSLDPVTVSRKLSKLSGGKVGRKSEIYKVNSENLGGVLEEM